MSFGWSAGVSERFTAHDIPFLIAIALCVLVIVVRGDSSWFRFWGTLAIAVAVNSLIVGNCALGSDLGAKGFCFGIFWVDSVVGAVLPSAVALASGRIIVRLGGFVRRESFRRRGRFVLAAVIVVLVYWVVFTRGTVVLYQEI